MTQSSNSLWNDFDHQIWKIFKENDLHECSSYLLAVSGGLDSMVLLDVVRRLRPQSEIRVAHFHHGDGENQDYRDRAAEVVKHNTSIYFNEYLFEKSDIELTSENEMRQARWNFLRNVQKPNEPILTAHHLDDWVETITLKLIRGTSIDGVQNFKIWNNEIFRPFLRVNKSELEKYARCRNLQWVDDPSNQSDHYLRNWLRHKWFAELDNKVPGGYHNFSKSLLSIVADSTHDSTLGLVYYKNSEAEGLDRAWFLTLTASERLRALAGYLKKHQKYQFTRGQLEEICKRLDKNQKDITFSILDRKWVINATQIMIES